MEILKNRRVTFVLPGEITLVEVIDEILKNNGIQESEEEYMKKSQQGIDTKFIIIRDTALTIVEKKIPEKKLAELLEKHLEIKQPAAENIIKDINEKLIPYAKVIGASQELKKDFQKELLEKIRTNMKPAVTDENKIPELNLQEIAVTDVEKNAEKIKIERKPIVSAVEEKPQPQPPVQNTKPDDYREPTE